MRRSSIVLWILLFVGCSNPPSSGNVRQAACTAGQAACMIINRVCSGGEMPVAQNE